MRFDIDIALQGIRDPELQGAGETPRKPRFSVDESLGKIRSSQPQVETPTNQPIVEEEKPKQIIPDNWNLEITGETNEEIKQKVYNLKGQFPDLELTDNQGTLNLKVPKGNKELSDKVYRYLNKIPVEKKNESQIPETTIETEAPYTKGLYESFVKPQIEVLKDPTQIVEQTKQWFTNAKDYIKEASMYGYEGETARDRFMAKFKNLGDSYYELGNKINKGLNGDYTELANGLMGIAFSPFSLAQTISETVPGGKFVYDALMIEPELVGGFIGDIVNEIDMPEKYKELATNIGMLGALHFKGKIAKKYVEGRLNELSQKEITKIIEESRKEVQEKYDPITKTQNEIETLKERVKKEKDPENKLKLAEEIEKKETELEDFGRFSTMKILEKPQETLLLEEPKNRMYVDEKGNIVTQEQFDKFQTEKSKSKEPLEYKDYLETISDNVKKDLNVAKLENDKLDLQKDKADLSTAKTLEEKETKIKEIRRKEKVITETEDILNLDLPENIKEVKGKFEVTEPDGNKTRFVKKEEAIKWNEKLQSEKQTETKEKPKVKTGNLEKTLIDKYGMQEAMNIASDTKKAIQDLKTGKIYEGEKTDTKHTRAIERIKEEMGADYVDKLAIEDKMAIGEIKDGKFVRTDIKETKPTLEERDIKDFNKNIETLKNRGREWGDIAKKQFEILGHTKEEIANMELPSHQRRAIREINFLLEEKPEFYNKIPREIIDKFPEIKSQKTVIKPEGKDLNVNGTLIPFESLKIWDNVKSNVDLFKEVSRIALDKAKQYGNDFKNWGLKVMREVGDWVRPHLKKLWEEINKPLPEVEKLQREGIDINTQGFSLKKKQKSFNDFIDENLGKIKAKEMRSAYEEYLKGGEKQVKFIKQLDYTKEKIAKHRIKEGDKKSEYEFNPNTVNKEINDNVKEYVNNNLEMMKELRRQRITDNQAISRAKELSTKLTDEKILSIKRGETMPIEEHLATVVYTSKRIKEAIAKNDIEDISNALLMWAKTEAIGGELGRSLRGRQLVPKFNLDEIKLLADKVPEEFKPDIKPLIDKVIKENNPDWLDITRYYLYNAMLSRPVTHLRNVVGNTSHLLYEALGIGLKDPVSVVRGLKEGIKTIKPDLKRIWNEGGEMNKFQDLGKQYEPKNKKLRNAMPLTYLKLEDVIFKELAKGIEKELQVKQLSKEYKENPESVRQFIEDVANGKELETTAKTERYLKSLDEIQDFAKYITFQKPLGETGVAIQNLINKTKVGFLVTPFVRTPVNILKVGLQPLKVVKFASPEYRAKFKEMSPVAKQHELRRITAGAFMYGTFATMVMNGMIDVTGSGADNKAQQDLLDQTGWKPNSIKIGNRYISYQNLNPLNVFLGMLGNFSDNVKYNTKPKDDELNTIQKISKTLAGSLETFTDQSFLQGLNNLFKWVNKKDPYYLEQFLQMPVPGALSIPKDVEIYFGGDDYQYETKGFWDKLMNRVGYTEGLKEKLDIFGQPKERKYETLPIAFKEKENKLAEVLLDKNVTIGFPSKDVMKSNGEKITDNEYYEYQKETGQKIKNELEKNLSKIEGMDNKDADDFVDDITKKIRDDYRIKKFGKKKK